MQLLQDKEKVLYKIIDDYNRTFKKLRISLTNHCNLACKYCVSGKEAGYSDLRPSNNIGKQLSPVEIINIVKSIHYICELNEIKLTGGEPLLFNGIFELIEGLNKLEIKKVSLTTNGFFLKHKAHSIIDLGVKNINVSLDATKL